MERALRSALEQLDVTEELLKRIAKKRPVIRREMESVGYVGF